MSGHIFPLLLSFVWNLALMLLCVLAHELGHVVVARYHHVPVRKIGFSWMGMYIQRARTTGWPEISVCLAGAAMNLLLAATFWNLNHWFALCNLVLGIVNLLPITNSDGSHAIAAFQAMQRQPLAVKQPTRIG